MQHQHAPVARRTALLAAVGALLPLAGCSDDAGDPESPAEDLDEEFERTDRSF